jgi:hypothetical protein
MIYPERAPLKRKDMQEGGSEGKRREKSMSEQSV